MTTATTTTGTYQGKTADQWRAEAAAENARRNESWERSDTDGFISQWAHQMGEGENHLKARLAEQNGMTETDALFDLDGNLIPTVHGYGEYGAYFLILDAEGNKDTTQGRNGFFSPSKAQNADVARKNNAAKGFYVGTVRVAATTKIVGGGKGLAGAATCYPAIVPASQMVTADTAEIIDNGHEQPVIEEQQETPEQTAAADQYEAETLWLGHKVRCVVCERGERCEKGEVLVHSLLAAQKARKAAEKPVVPVNPTLKGKAQRRVYAFLMEHPGLGYTVPQIVSGLNARGENTYYNATATAAKALAAAGLVKVDGKAFAA